MRVDDVVGTGHRQWAWRIWHSARHRMTFDSSNEGSTCVSMTWRANISARHYLQESHEQGALEQRKNQARVRPHDLFVEYRQLFMFPVRQPGAYTRPLFNST